MISDKEFNNASLMPDRNSTYNGNLFENYKLPSYNNPLDYGQFNNYTTPTKKLYSYKLLNLSFDKTKKPGFTLEPEEMKMVAEELRAHGQLGWKYEGIIEVLGYAALVFTQDTTMAYRVTTTGTTAAQ